MMISMGVLQISNNWNSLCQAYQRNDNRYVDSNWPYICNNVEGILRGVSETYYSFHKFIWRALLWLSRVIQHESYALRKCIMEGITVNCQRWHNLNLMGSEECITESITVNCQWWYSMSPMVSGECITESITVNCQGWYNMSPMVSEDCITEDITLLWIVQGDTAWVLWAHRSV